MSQGDKKEINIDSEPSKEEKKDDAAAPAVAKKKKAVPDHEPSIKAYLGAEMYSQRMYPQGCPSFQKAQVRLFKVYEENGKQKLRLVDSHYFTNREGFGYILKNLTKGEYQIQIKKYSFGFDVFDFTVRLFTPKYIKLIDNEEVEVARQKAKHEKKKEEIGSSRTITESSSPSTLTQKYVGKKHFTKAGNQDMNEKKMIDVDPHTMIDMELHKQT